MGKSWLHIQDGTGDPTTHTHDLVVTSSALFLFSSQQATCFARALAPNQGAAILVLGDARFKKVFFLV
jgi:hypothetical protein